MRTDDPSDIIEIIDDDTDAFGERGRAATVHDDGGPRWVGPAAVAVLATLIAYGVATSASSTSLPRAAPAPSTTAPTRPSTTLPAVTTTTEPAPPVPYYAADPPREFSVQYAEIQPSDGFPPFAGYQLWATEGSSASAGSWFSIETYPGAGSSIYAIDAFRVQTATHSIGISHTSSGQTTAQFTDQGQSGVALTSYGIADDTLIRLADSISVEQREIHLNDQSLLVGYSLLSTVSPWFVVQGVPVEQVFYTAGNDGSSTIGLSIAQQPSSGTGGDSADRSTALQFFLDGARPFDIGRYRGVAGTIVGQPDYSLATWAVDDHIITVTATMPVEELVGIATTVHQVTASEWNGMKFQAARHNADNNFGDYQETQPAAVSFGADANGNSWKIDVSVATFANTQQVNWQWGGNGFGTTLGSDPGINSVVEGQRTYVLADLPRSVAASAQLQIARAGLDPVTVPFLDVGADLDRTFAAYAFSEPAPYSAQIVGDDGTVLASWPVS